MLTIDKMMKEKATISHQNVLNALTIVEENNISATNLIKDGKCEDLKVCLYQADTTLKGPKLGAICALAKMSYSAGSQVGLIISSLSIADTLMDNELNKQFLIPGTLMVCKNKIKKVFKEALKSTTGTIGYTPVFKDDEFIVATSKWGIKQLILLALSKRINEFAQKLEQLSEATQSDLVLIGKDLNIIATVMSEIEIDAAKKPWLKEGLLDISEFMSTMMNLKSKKLLLSSNFSDIESNHKGYIKGDVTFKFEIEEQMLLSDYETLVQQKTAFIESSNLKEEDKIKQIAFFKNQILKECVIVDSLSQLSEEMIKAANIALITPLVNLYKESDNSLLNFEKNFTIGKTPEEAAKIEQNVAAVERVAVIIMEMIYSKFQWGKVISIAKSEEMAAIGRNIIYTAGKNHGFTPEDTFLIAANAGWKNRQGKRRLNPKLKGDFRFKAIELLFSKEVKCFFNEDIMRQSIEVELPEEIFEIEDAIAHGQILDFEDGQAYIATNDEGEDLMATRLDIEDFTGQVAIIIDSEGYIDFLENLNPYTFEEVDYLLFDSVSDVLAPESKISVDLFEDMIASSLNDPKAISRVYNKSILKNVKTNVAENEEIETKSEVEKLMSTKLNYTQNLLGLIKNPEYTSGMRNGFMYVRKLDEDGQPGNGRLVGAVESFNARKALSQNEHLIPIVTPVGAILLAK